MVFHDSRSCKTRKGGSAFDVKRTWFDFHDFSSRFEQPSHFTVPLSLSPCSIYLTTLDTSWHGTMKNKPIIHPSRRCEEIAIIHRLGETKTFSITEPRNNRRSYSDHTNRFTPLFVWPFSHGLLQSLGPFSSSESCVGFRTEPIRECCVPDTRMQILREAGLDSREQMTNNRGENKLEEPTMSWVSCGQSDWMLERETVITREIQEPIWNYTNVQRVIIVILIIVICIHLY